MLAATFGRPFGPLPPLSLPQHFTSLSRARTILSDKPSRFMKLDLFFIFSRDGKAVHALSTRLVHTTARISRRPTDSAKGRQRQNNIIWPRHKRRQGRDTPVLSAWIPVLESRKALVPRARGPGRNLEFFSLLGSDPYDEPQQTLVVTAYWYVKGLFFFAHQSLLIGQCQMKISSLHLRYSRWGACEIHLVMYGPRAE